MTVLCMISCVQRKQRKRDRKRKGEKDSYETRTRRMTCLDVNKQLNRKRMKEGVNRGVVLFQSQHNSISLPFSSLKHTGLSCKLPSLYASFVHGKLFPLFVWRLNSIRVMSSLLPLDCFAISSHLSCSTLDSLFLSQERFQAFHAWLMFLL